MPRQYLFIFYFENRPISIYNLSLLYCIPLILIGMGLIKWCGSLERMDLSKLKFYYRALAAGGSHAFPWKSIWR